MDLWVPLGGGPWLYHGTEGADLSTFSGVLGALGGKWRWWYGVPSAGSAGDSIIARASRYV